MSRFSKREEVRRNTAYIIKQQILNQQLALTSKRILLPTKEYQQCLIDICRNSISRFGIVRLSKVYLDEPIPITSCKEIEPFVKAWTQPGTVEGPLAKIPTVTLIEFSSLRRRDAITSALLRAGADATAGLGYTAPALASEVHAHLLQLPGQFAVHIVNTFFSMRRSLSTCTRSNVCERESGSSAATYNYCDACQVDLNPSAQYCQSYVCLHWLCKSCFWTTVLGCRYVDVCCPLCGLEFATQSSQSDESELLVSAILNEQELCSAMSSGQCQITEQTRIISVNKPNANSWGFEGDFEDYDARQARRQESLQKFLLLPQHTHELSKNAHKKPPFRAQSMQQLDGQFLGSIRSKRTEEFLQAAMQGRSHRVCWILETGVDVDHVDEYGHTALFLAATNGHTDVVQRLLHFGADISITDNAGCTPIDVADCLGHTAVTTLLRRAYCLTPSEELQSSSRPSICDYFLNVATDVAPKGELSVTTLIGEQYAGPGAGSYLLDGFFTEDFLQALTFLFSTLPIAPATKPSCSRRAYYYDVLGWIQRTFQNVLRHADIGCSEVMPKMRFLHYPSTGGYLAPHIDLSKTDDAGRFSTHTFILYLRDCPMGGETVLLRRIPMSRSSGIDGHDDDQSHCATGVSICEGVFEGVGEGVGAVVEGGDRMRVHARGAVQQGRVAEANVHGCNETETETEMKSSSAVQPRCADSAVSHDASASCAPVDKNDDYGSGEDATTSTTSTTTTTTVVVAAAVAAAANGDRARAPECPLAVVTPRRGRLLLFPHACPHEGWSTVSPDSKLLLRGEML